jgi:hypothetical protein
MHVIIIDQMDMFINHLRAPGVATPTSSPSLFHARLLSQRATLELTGLETMQRNKGCGQRFIYVN